MSHRHLTHSIAKKRKYYVDLYFVTLQIDFCLFFKDFLTNNKINNKTLIMICFTNVLRCPTIISLSKLCTQIKRL